MKSNPQIKTGKISSKINIKQNIMTKLDSKKLNVAFWGGGINSAVGNAHYSAINIDNNFELVSGFFSRNQEINKKSAEQYRVKSDRLYNDFRDFVKNEKGKIDAVILLTPTDQHAEQVIFLLENEIPVICEKSLSGSLEEIQTIKNLLKSNNGFLAVIYNYLGYPVLKELKIMIEKGKLGKINHIQVEMPQEGFARVDADNKPKIPQDWRLKDNIVPTISLDLGVHLHMLIKYLINKTPLSVVAKGSRFGNFKSIIDNVSCMIEYSDDVTCNMWYSKIAIGNRNGMRIRIYGEKGAAEWIQENPEVLYLADNLGNRWKFDRGNENGEVCNLPRYNRFKVGHPAGFLEAFANYYHDIALSLRDYKLDKMAKLEECFGIDESEEGLRLFEAIQKSAETKSWQKV
jgi:predicted dehydrogenase